MDPLEQFGETCRKYLNKEEIEQFDSSIIPVYLQKTREPKSLQDALKFVRKQLGRDDILGSKGEYAGFNSWENFGNLWLL